MNGYKSIFYRNISTYIYIYIIDRNFADKMGKYIYIYIYIIDACITNDTLYI